MVYWASLEHLQGGAGFYKMNVSCGDMFILQDRCVVRRPQFRENARSPISFTVPAPGSHQLKFYSASGREKYWPTFFKRQRPGVPSLATLRVIFIILTWNGVSTVTLTINLNVVIVSTNNPIICWYKIARKMSQVPQKYLGIWGSVSGVDSPAYGTNAHSRISQYIILWVP